MNMVCVGELRPSQFVWSHGIGSLVDLPHLSVVVMGLENWQTDHCRPIIEKRLLAAVRRKLGRQVFRLLAPPPHPETEGPFNPFGEETNIGVPVTPFPRWLRCPLCGHMGEYDSRLFELKSNPYRPDQTRYVHSNCAKAQGRRPPNVVPARFLVACRDGHLDDFPWHWFVHRGESSCRGQLRFYEVGASLQTDNLWVECLAGCGAKARSMAEAFGDRGKEALPACRGRHPHIGDWSSDCSAPLKTVLLGGSNSWFPLTMTLLALPTEEGKLQQLVESNWHILQTMPDLQTLRHCLTALKSAGQLPGIWAYADEKIWQVVEEMKAGGDEEEDDDEETNFKIPEWEIFTSPNPPQEWPDFTMHKVDPPSEYRTRIREVGIVERLREVNAMIGFTRVEPPGEKIEGQDPPNRAPISSAKPEWIPANEVRGEGLFLRFDMDSVAKWLDQDAVRKREKQLLEGHKGWRAARRLEPHEAGFPGILYVMLQTLSHALIREFALECGYGASSIRERVYASSGGEGPKMAGILLYTAASDSDGTLGGLVELGRPVMLGRLLNQALDRLRICSSDPLCAEHLPARDRTLHGAACHACCFVSETSCEMGNRYLDRKLLVPTVDAQNLAFFGDIT